MVSIEFDVEELGEIATHREFSRKSLDKIGVLAENIVKNARQYGVRPYEFEILVRSSKQGSEKLRAKVELKIDDMNRTNYYMQFDVDNGTSYPRVHRMHDKKDETIKKFLLNDLELAFQQFARDLADFS